MQNQRGQGTTEYLLVLVLSVAIILGAIVQLNTAFRAWADNYFGDYLTCLLETGELPSLGGGTSGACDGSFKAFSLADGRPALGRAIGEGGGGGGGGGKDDASANEGDRPLAPTAGAEGGGANSASSFSRAGGRRGTRFKVRNSSGIGSDSDGAKSDQSGTVAFNSYDQNNRVVRIPVRETEAMRRRRYAEDQKDPERSKAKTDKALEGDERSGAPTLIRKQVRKPTAEIEDTGFEWSFGNLLRILIIAAILIALLLFLGGQALQVSKSLD